MIRTSHGLAFRVHSPSLYELVTHDDVGDPRARVTLAFMGTAWQLCYHAGNGHKVFRVFRSRDAAICLIANRRASA